MPELLPFLEESYSGVRPRWDRAQVNRVAALAAPVEALHGSYTWLVGGDLHLLWAKWFAEGIVDPDRYVGMDGDPFALVYELVRDHMPTIMPQNSTDERNEMAVYISLLLMEEVGRREDAPSRRKWTNAEKAELWDLAGPTPRCWICGRTFSDDAGKRFLGGQAAPDPKPTFVDFLYPRGAFDHDLRIEIDHVGALAAGGDEGDLRLACGWCNRNKRERSLLYETPSSTRTFEHPDPTVGRVGVPHPFWVVRAFAMQRKCQDPGDCPHSTANYPTMLIAPRRLEGQPNPLNLQVVCDQHDPLAGVRLIERQTYFDRARR